MKNYLLSEHDLPHNLKTIIYDCIHNQYTLTKFTTSEYLVQINATNEAEIFFFNSQLSAITNNLKINYLNNEKCFRFKNKQHIYKIIVCAKQEILIYRAQVNQFGQFQRQFQIFHFKVNLQKHQEFVYLSDSISIANYQYYIGYTNKDQFYLISTKYEYSSYKFDCVKLNDLDESKGILGWFAKKEKKKYSVIKLHLVGLLTGQQAIRVVSVRDSQIMVHLVEIHTQLKKSTIKVLTKVNTLQQLISSKSIILETFILKNQPNQGSQEQSEHVIQFIAVFKQKERTELIDVEIYISQIHVLPHCRKIFTLQSSLLLSLVTNHKLFFFCWFNYQTKKYIVNLFNLEELMTLTIKTLQESRAYIQEESQIFLCNGKNEVYLFADSNILKYEHLKDSKIYLQNIKKLQKILYKAVQIEDYEIITKIIHKIEENYKNTAQFQDDYQKNYLQSFILGKILDSKLFFILQKTVKHLPKYRESGQNVLTEACKQINLEDIKNLIDFIANQKLYELLVNVIFQVHKEFCFNENLDLYHQFLNEVFSDAIEKTLKNLLKQLDLNSQNLKWYLLLLDSFVYFKQIDPEHLLAIVNHNPDKFIQNIIINHQKKELFLYFFNYPQIEFDASDIKLLFQKAEKERENVKPFIKELIRLCYGEWRNKEGGQKKYYLQFVRKRVTALIHGLEKYSEIVIGQLENTLPGLAVYFYLKKDRIKYADKILSLANKSQNPETSYILKLASGKIKKYNKEDLDHIRLCHELKQFNQTPSELLSQLQKNNFNDVEVRRETWQIWKKSHSYLKSDFSAIQKKLSFYKNQND